MPEITISNDKEVLWGPLTEEQYDAIKLLFLGFRCPCQLLRDDQEWEKNHIDKK